MAPVAGQAAPMPRAGAAFEQNEKLRGTTLWIVGAIALGLIVWGALEILDNDTNAVPSSP